MCVILCDSVLCVMLLLGLISLPHSRVERGVWEVGVRVTNFKFPGVGAGFRSFTIRLHTLGVIIHYEWFYLKMSEGATPFGPLMIDEAHDTRQTVHGCGFSHGWLGWIKI